LNIFQARKTKGGLIPLLTANSQEVKAMRDKELIKKHPNLIPVEPNKYPNQTLAAKNIRRELKKHFPNIKFSVTSKSYSMGDNVNVTWTNGPAKAKVEAITNKYQYGWFDGMTDCYNSNNDPFNNVFGGTKHLFTDRKYSDEVIQSAIDTVWKKFGVEEPLMTAEDYKQGNTWYVKIGRETTQTMIYRELQQLPTIS
jgi:hypothetical protein